MLDFETRMMLSQNIFVCVYNSTERQTIKHVWIRSWENMFSRLKSASHSLFAFGLFFYPTQLFFLILIARIHWHFIFNFCFLSFFIISTLLIGKREFSSLIIKQELVVSKFINIPFRCSSLEHTDGKSSSKYLTFLNADVKLHKY